MQMKPASKYNHTKQKSSLILQNNGKDNTSLNYKTDVCYSPILNFNSQSIDENSD